MNISTNFANEVCVRDIALIDIKGETRWNYGERANETICLGPILVGDSKKIVLNNPSYLEQKSYFSFTISCIDKYGEKREYIARSNLDFSGNLPVFYIEEKETK